MNRKIRIILAAALLLVGIAIYLLFRSGNMLVFRLTDLLGLTALLDHGRHAVSGTALPEWLLFSMPNGLWAMAYILLIDSIFHRQSLPTRMSWAAVIPACGLLGEMMQALHLLTGTFDWIDVAWLTLPYCIYFTISIIFSRLKTYNHED